ncbi:MAG: hypothetical protein HY865_26140 [Chloroflexi bacterium]|nr:hypothetical protein [Chloroflexota bacterium]
MFKKIGSITIIILATILLGYSASRSLDFIQLTLPPERAILAYFGLAALDGGLIAWLLSYLYGSRGWQRAISLIMVLVDLVGAVAMFTLDTLYNTGKAGMTTALTADQLQTAVLMLSAVIGLNIAAAVAHHMTNPDQLREQAEEEAFDKVETATLKQISKNADQLAAQLAPTLAADWMQNTRARYMSYVGTGKIPTLLDGKAEDVAPAMPIIPILAEQPKPKAQPFDIGALWGGFSMRRLARSGRLKVWLSRPRLMLCPNRKRLKLNRRLRQPLRPISLLPTPRRMDRSGAGVRLVWQSIRRRFAWEVLLKLMQAESLQRKKVTRTKVTAGKYWNEDLHSMRQSL